MAAAQPVAVTVECGSATSNPSTYNYCEPVVSGIAPRSSSLAGGTTVIVSGQYLDGAGAVFFGDEAAAAFQQVSDRTIVATSPSSPALASGATSSPVHVRVEVQGVKSSRSHSALYTYYAPQVGLVTPAQGPVHDRSPVTLTGRWFDGVTAVEFGGEQVVAGGWKKVDDQTITATPPPPAQAGTVHARAEVQGTWSAKSAGSRFTYVPAPVVTGLSPAQGPDAGGISVTVTGRGFTGATAVHFGEVAATIQGTVTDSSITVTAPAGTGSVDVTVTTPEGTSAPSGRDQFRYASLPLAFDLPGNLTSQGIYLTMFGTLLEAHESVFGVSIAADTTVFLAKMPGTDSWDYLPCSAVGAGQSLPPFLYTQASGGLQPVVSLPNLQIASARVVIGMGQVQATTVASGSGGTSLPQANVQVASTAAFEASGSIYVRTPSGIAEIAYTGTSGTAFTGCSGGTGTLQTGASVFAASLPTPKVNPGGHTVAAPTPALQGAHVYDFFEFTYNRPGGTGTPLTLTINTSAIDQFGLPVVLEVAGGSVAPNRVGVRLARDTVFSRFAAAAAGTGYDKLVNAPGGGTPIRILSPADYEGTPNPPKGSLKDYFDQALTDLFDTATGAILLTVTDGSSPPNGLQYTMKGSLQSPPPGWLQTATGTSAPVLEFECVAIGNNPGGITPLIPLSSKMFVYCPFFSSNGGKTNPGPPSWGGTTMANADVSPTGMVFAANGVFADNAQQSAALYDNSNQPAGLQQNAYSVAVGAIEDQLNAALLRGIATDVYPPNWANAPSGVRTAKPISTGSLPAGTYHYVVTAMTPNGEGPPSIEASYTLVGQGGVRISWNYVDGATGYRVYRGTAAGGENVLVRTASDTENAAEDLYPSPLLPEMADSQSGATPAPDLTSLLPQDGGSLSPTMSYSYVVKALGPAGESPASPSASFQPTTTQRSVKVVWTAVPRVAAYRIYRAGGPGPHLLAATIPGPGSGSSLSFIDTGAVAQNPPPVMYYAPGSIFDLYAQFFHRPDVSYGGLAYAAPFDDQGGQSSTISAVSPRRVTIGMGTET